MIQPLVSIVILSWNRRDALRYSLEKINKNDYPYLEIIVVDNGSADRTQEMIKNDFTSVKLIALNKNIGIAAYNDGFRSAKGDYIVILDDDSYPAENAISKAVEVLEQDANTVCIAFNILNPKIKGCETKNWPSEVFTFIGCGAIVRTSLLKKVGYYNPDFFLYCNELDLSIRLLNESENNKIKFYNDIIGNHMIAEANRSGKRRAFFEIRNNLWILWQYFSFWLAVRLSMRRIFEEFIFMFTWHKSITGYFGGLFSAFFGITNVLKKRIVIDRKLQMGILNSQTYILGEPIIKFFYKNIIAMFSKIKYKNNI